jgi:hypothetical protein
MNVAATVLALHRKPGMQHARARTGMAPLLFVVALLGPGCRAQSSVAPSEPPPVVSQPAASTSVLTVRVLTRASEQPIARAEVRTSTSRAMTGSDGVCVLDIIPGEELEVTVSAAGYQTIIAAGVLGSHERWTFYLQQA